MTGQEAEIKFQSIYRAHHKRVLAFCLRRNSRDGWDVAAETFAVAWRRIEVVPNHQEALPWLYAVARKLLANVRRKEASASRLERRVGADVKLGHTGPEDQVVRRSEERQLLAALHRLRPDDREVLRLRTWEELSHREVAEVLGISVAAAGQRVHRATRRLARELSKSSGSLGSSNPLVAKYGRTT